MGKKETETYCYEPTIVNFKSLGYSITEYVIEGDYFKCRFSLEHTSIDSIIGSILKFCEAYEINLEEIRFQTPREIFNAINQKTLSSNKTVWELFNERNIVIEVER